MGNITSPSVILQKAQTSLITMYIRLCFCLLFLSFASLVTTPCRAQESSPLLIDSSSTQLKNTKEQNANQDALKKRVVDLRYGNALYHFFQGEELQALTELMLAHKHGGIQGHGDNPAIMQAGISLAYGMADDAQALFLELLDQNRPEHVRNAAWYYLARLHYLRANMTTSLHPFKCYAPTLP